MLVRPCGVCDSDDQARFVLVEFGHVHDVIECRQCGTMVMRGDLPGVLTVLRVDGIDLRPATKREAA